MPRLPIVALVLGAAISLAACGGGSAPEASSAPSVAPTPAITEPAGSAKPGKPVVPVNGSKVRVEGIGIGISPEFELTGNMVMTTTPCSATGVMPFIVLRSATTNLAPTYVDQVVHLTNLSGKYDVEVSPAPTCAWVVEFTAE